MADANPKKLTIYGRLSFPTLTAEAAYDLSQRGSYPAKDVGSAQPSFQLLVSQSQWEKFYNHAVNVFLPYCVAQSKAGEKKDVLGPQEVKQLIAGLDDLDSQVFNSPAKPVHEKSLELAPDTVATIKAIGGRGVDMTQSAIVNSEDELAVPDPDLLKFPVVRPLHQTVHELYPGCYAAATLNLYSYHNGKHPGFSAGANTVVFKQDAERFGGSEAVDEDEIFLD